MTFLYFLHLYVQLGHDTILRGMADYGRSDVRAATLCSIFRLITAINFGVGASPSSLPLFHFSLLLHVESLSLYKVVVPSYKAVLSFPSFVLLLCIASLAYSTGDLLQITLTSPRILEQA